MTRWPYPIEYDKEASIETDVLVLGGGISGCMAAIEAAKKGLRVTLVEKGEPKRSGAGGSGCDHWESAASNPCSRVDPETLTVAMLDDNQGFNNGISHYIECRDGYKTLLDIEKMGGKIRDTDNEFMGANFRDEATGLMFAYDYDAKITLRIWGTTFKPAMAKELKRLGVNVVSRVMATSLLTKDGEPGSPCIGATGLHTRTGKFFVFRSKATIMCLSRPARVWLFNPSMVGLSEFRPPQCIGDGHAMGYRSGATFVMMEKSVGAQFSAAGRSFPPYGAGNNHNTWYPATLIDSKGREIPYEDRDGKILKTFAERVRPAKGQKFFLKGGAIEEAKYPYKGPETIPFETIMKQGYEPPFYADLTTMPELERKVIWGMMVGEEGKTQVPIKQNYEKRGFDPSKDVLQCYGTGWTSAQFMPNERQLFGLPGGFLNDWRLMSSLEGLFVGGDALYASNCYGHAATTGAYAGRQSVYYCQKESNSDSADTQEALARQVEREKQRIYQPIINVQMAHDRQLQGLMSWKELNGAISKAMQMYCGAVKDETRLKQGLQLLNEYEGQLPQQVGAMNPHELTRLLEVMDILTVSKMIIEASLERQASCPPLDFYRSDSKDSLAQEENCLIGLKRVGDHTVFEKIPLDYFGDLEDNYRRVNI